MPNCFRLFRHWISCPLVLALESTGKSSDARMAMMAVTISSSMSVNAERDRFNVTTRQLEEVVPSQGRWHSRFRMGEEPVNYQR